MMTTIKRQTASMEDYLEAIAILDEKGDAVTVTSIGKMMGVRKPSVNWALTKLSEAGLVSHEKYKGVELTAEGARLAQDVYHRHKILRSFLTEVLEVNPETAEQDACRMEHLLSPASMTKLEKFIDFILSCHPGKARWHDVFQDYLNNGCTNVETNQK